MTKGITMPRAGKPKESKPTMTKATVKKPVEKAKSYAKNTPKKKKKSGSA